MAEQIRPWKRALVWLLLLAPFFFASYSFSNWLAAQRSDVGVVVFDWEHGMPFIPWSILPYWSIDLFYGLSLLLPRTRDELDAHVKRLFTAQVISVLCFIAFPLRFSFERPETSGITGWLFDVLLGFDKPFNQAPSLHISLLVILWTLYARYLTGWWLWSLRLIAVSIGFSVLTTYQHHFIDIPTGALVGCIAVMLFPLQPQTAIIQRDPRRFVLGAYYLTGAVILGVLAMLLKGAWLWLLWGSCALAAVAIIYFLGNPLLFRHHNGRMEEAVLVLLAPYLLGAWLNSRCWTYKHPEPDEIVPELWLSRLPSRSMIKRLQPLVLIDCCAELPLISCGQRVHSVPMLDLLAPEVEQIEQGVAAINATRKSGNTLVFCALGYSRSAVIVIASLIEKGHATNIDAAIERVRKARPRLVLPALHRAKLDDWYARKNDKPQPCPAQDWSADMNEKTANNDSVTSATSAALLDSISKVLNNWSMWSALAAIMIIPDLKQGGFYSSVFLGASLMVALLQGYFAARCAFDSAVFAALGGNLGHYQDFDQVLTRWKLRRASTITRSLNDRVQGAMRLLRWQAICFFVQIVLLATALIVVLNM